MKRSKFTEKLSTPAKTNGHKTQVPTPTEEPETLRQRRERPYNMYTYRGLTFILAFKGDNTVVSLVNPETKQPESVIEVPRAMGIKAAQSIAKINLTEQLLERLSVHKDG